MASFNEEIITDDYFKYKLGRTVHCYVKDYKKAGIATEVIMSEVANMLAKKKCEWFCDIVSKFQILSVAQLPQEESKVETVSSQPCETKQVEESQPEEPRPVKCMPEPDYIRKEGVLIHYEAHLTPTSPFESRRIVFTFGGMSMTLVMTDTGFYDSYFGASDSPVLSNAFQSSRDFSQAVALIISKLPIIFLRVTKITFYCPDTDKRFEVLEQFEYEYSRYDMKLIAL